MGQKTSSDLYVEGWASTNKMILTFIGKTATIIEKTGGPIWNEGFDLEPPRENPKVVLKSLVEDYLSEPDVMGAVVTIEIPTKP
jgi:hypothetical protein